MRNENLVKAAKMIEGYASRETSLSDQDYLEIQNMLATLETMSDTVEGECLFCSYRICKSLLDGIVAIIEQPEYLDLWDSEGLYKSLMMGYMALRV